jgi:hypothetical protein
MDKAKSLDDLKPKNRCYILVKEIRAVSISDALRKEKSGQIIRVQEVENETEDGEDE